MLTNDELDELERDYRAPTAVHALVRELVGELRAERTRTETLRAELEDSHDTERREFCQEILDGIMESQPTTSTEGSEMAEDSPRGPVVLDEPFDDDGVAWAWIRAHEIDCDLSSAVGRQMLAVVGLLIQERDERRVESERLVYALSRERDAAEEARADLGALLREIFSHFYDDPDVLVLRETVKAWRKRAFAGSVEVSGSTEGASE